jgi:hypothetical protein
MAFAGALLFSPIDRGALSLSRRWREGLSGMTMETTDLPQAVVAPGAIPAE